MNMNLLSTKKFGFRPKTSKEDTILALLDIIFTTLNETRPCLFIDLTKAFDTARYTILLQTLENIGIRRNCLNCSQLIY